MALSLQPRQVQKQVATPAMMMEMSLLALPVSDLKEAVRREIDSNPALEADGPFSAGPFRPPAPSAAGDREAFLESIADERGETLDEHLLGELRMAGVAGRELELCRAVIAELDGDGRFRGEVPSMEMATGASAAEIESARRRVMAIDPKGCGARDLAECFRAQTADLPAARRAAVEKAIDYVAAVERGEAAAKPGALDPAAVALLRRLDPFPGRQYGRRKVDYVVPDIHVDADGSVTVDQGDIPSLRVSPKYVEMAKNREIDEETRLYARDRVRRAREFRDAVLRRRETMERIAELVVGGQPEFLAKGTAGLRRLTMGEVAAKAKCDVSTVSRAAARKYVRTPHGTLPLRKFFVRVDQAPLEKLREILEGVPDGGRLSDREAAALMARAGYPMARRTVAKYRARLGFSPKGGSNLV